METIDHAVGPEKYELLAKQQGNDVSSSPLYAHRSGSGSKVNFGYQQKFQLDMNFWGKSYQKMHNLKISTGGPNF